MRIAGSPPSINAPIAVVGIGCLLPGAHSPEEFWAGLRAGTDQRSAGGPDVFGTGPDVPGGWGDDEHQITATRGGFVSEPNIELSGLRVSRSQLDGLGRVVRWPLYVIRQALADAGIAEQDDLLTRTGLVLGNYSFPTERSVELCLPLIHRVVDEGLRTGGLPVSPDSPAETVDVANRWPSGLPAMVTGQALGLGGPQLTLDAACASALYGMALARDYLATGRADVMLAGAVCAADPLMIHLSFSDLRAFPANGVSQPFREDSAGIVTGQGAGVLVLKRLADARRDGDRIHAVIRSVGLANDGAGAHVLTPTVRGQLDAYRHAYHRADQSTVDYLECHATGTPGGDSTELRGIAEFFGEKAPLLGSVKGNIGHLLTVAGFTSVLKVILAMRHSVIPATPGVTAPRRPRGAEAMADRLVVAEQDWPARAGTGTRLAAVSSFGFGGVNAHALLTTPEKESTGTEETARPPRLAVTGIGVRLGEIADRAALRQSVRAAEPVLRPLPAQRWDGAEEVVAAVPGGYIDSVDVDVQTYRIPPVELPNSNPQHLVLFHAADQALADAGFEPAGSSQQRRRVAVVIAMEMEPRSLRHRARFDIGAHVRQECARAGVRLGEDQLDKLESSLRHAMHEPLGANEVLSYIGSIMASRISAARNFSGPAFTISSDATAGARALEIAGLLLLDPSIEAVLVGGVELAGGVENTVARTELARQQGKAAPALGDGAVALVLSRDDAVLAGKRPYGTVDAVSVRPDPTALAESVGDGLRQVGLTASDVDYLELASPADPAVLASLARVFPAEESDNVRCAMGSLLPLIGDTQHASMLASLAKTLLCLDRAELPAAPQALTVAAGEIPELQDSALYLATDTTPWLASNEQGRRTAAVAAAGQYSAAHVVVSTEQPCDEEANWVESAGPLLLPLNADNADGIVESARHCLDELASGRDGLTIVEQWCRKPRAGRFTAVLVAEDSQRLRRELDAAVRDLPGMLADGGEWVTPAGSFCTAKPLGAQQRVAFVYPGAFTGYPGAGKDLFSLFPGLRAEFESRADVPATRFRHRTVYPRTTYGPDRRTLMRHEAGMIESIPEMLTIGTNFAVLHTRLLRDVLGLRLDGGFGYSLGESSMLFATGVWEPSARDDAALVNSALFRDQLRGPKRLVRATWRVPESTVDGMVWSTRVLLADVDEVTMGMTGLDRVFLTHINRPGEVVVAGDPSQCDELVERLGCPAVSAPANHVMHCPVVDAVLPELAALNTYPLGECDEGVELLSAYDYGPVDVTDSKRIAERIAWTLRSTIDFSRLTTVAHERNFRYFIEVGPGTTCSRWIKDTLVGREHLAVSVDRRGVGAGIALAQALAKLVSHGLPVRLDVLFPERRPPAARRTYRVTCGGESVADRVRVAVAKVGTESRPPGTQPPEQAAVQLAVPDDDVIVIEAEPFVDLRALPGTKQLVRQTNTVWPAGTARAIPHLRPLAELIRTVAEAHRSTLRTHNAIQELQLRRLEEDGWTDAVPSAATGSTARRTGRREPATRQDVIFDYADLLEFATGKVAHVFGPEFAAIDEYPVRVRLPEPPYLFVHRVTALDATVGRFEPSSISTEYDIPADAWYSVDGLVPCAVTIEAGQCDLLLISYLGIDFRNRGNRVYRLLDSQLVFHGDLPRAGQTVRYDISIDRFVANGDSLLFFFSYQCYADGELILELLNACAGFFSATELDSSLGIVPTGAERKRREAMTRGWFTPLARTHRTSLSGTDLEALSAGRLGDVFGPQWDQRADGCNRSIRLPGDNLRMIDEVTRIDRLGGPRGLGEVRAVKHLDEDGWYFRCHFTGDPVLAGSLVAEGAVQLLEIYAMYLGLHLVLPDGEFQPVPGSATQVKVRGQVTPKTPNIRYRVEISDITMLPRPTLVADIVVYDGDKPIIAMQDFGLQVREKPGTPYRAGAGGLPPFLGRRNHNGAAAFLNELHMAHAAKGDLGVAMGPEFDVYAGRRAPYIPNGDFRFVDRIMRLVGDRGRLEPAAFMATEYDCPPEAWYFRDGYHGMPNFVYMESSLQAAILLGYYLGATLDSPDEELSIRNLDGKATLVADMDLRGRTVRHSSTMLSSQRVPGAILQSFRYELSADGEVFYRGESLFGYFNEQALAHQIGLDSGERVPHWMDEHGDRQVGTRLVSTDQRWATDYHFRLIDEADIVLDGGRYGRGYVRGRRRINPDDWYFACHFHLDPVMPGSLGVEAVIQGLHVFAVESGLGSRAPVFATPCGVETGWRYRGQILRTDQEMTFELHVKEVRNTAGRVVLLADASVWKHPVAGSPGIRIYELTDVAAEIRDTEPHVADRKGEAQ